MVFDLVFISVQPYRIIARYNFTHTST